MSSSSI